MRVVVGKIEGVRSVKVSLKKGVATIQFSPANRVTLARIRQAIRSNGFTAREADVQVAGSLAHRGDSLLLVVPGTQEAFVLEDAPAAPSLIRELRRRDPSQAVVLTGQVPRPKGKDDRGPFRLLVRSYGST